MRIALAWVDLDDPTDRVIALGLAGEFRRLGHEVHIVGPERGETDAAAVSRLLRFHRTRAIDLWHCHVFGRSHAALARAAREGRFKLLVSLHLVLKDYLPFLGGRKGLDDLLKSTSRVTVPAESARKEFLGLFPEWRGRTSVVANGISSAPAAPRRPKDVRAPFILSVARLAPYKGPDLLLMAFAQVRRGLRLVLSGRDQLDGGVQKLAERLGVEDRVVLTGELPPSAVARLLKDCEFLVLASRRENLPLAVLEAMAAGKPVVAFAVGGVPEMVRDKTSGFLVPPGDVNALARRIEELSDDKALQARMGRAALKRSREFTWRRAAMEFERVFPVRRRARPGRRGAGRGRLGPRSILPAASSCRRARPGL